MPQAQAPGIYFNDVAAPPQGDQGPQTGTAFAVLYTAKSPGDDKAWAVTSKADFNDKFGPLLSVSVADDWVDAYFKLNGGSGRLVVSRNVVLSTTPASVNLAGSAGTTLVVSAKSRGTLLNGWTVDVLVSSGTYSLVIKDGAGAVRDQSFPLTTRDDAVTWASAYAKNVVVTAGGGTASAPVAVTASAMTGGTDSTSTDVASLTAAVARFDDQLGSGTVVIPGCTASVLHRVALAHVSTRPRTASLTLAPGYTATDAVAAAQNLYQYAGSDRATLCVQNLVLPGGVLGASRKVPWDVVIAAHAARADATTVPGVALAGETYGAVTGAGGIPIQGATVDTLYSEADRGLLDDAGLTVAITDVVAGQTGVPVTYSDRTITPYQAQDKYTEYSDARIRMVLHARALFRSKPSAFARLGGIGLAVAKLAGDLKTMAQDLYRADVLDGATYEQAYQSSAVADKPNKAINVTLAAQSANSARTITVNIARPYQGA